MDADEFDAFYTGSVASGSQNERITIDRLVARASGDDRTRVAVWLKRNGSGPVVYLAEQYLP